MWEGGAAAQQEGGKTSEELSLGGSPATWLFGHSREEACKQGSEHDQFSSSLPNEPGEAGLPAWAAALNRTKPFQCESNGSGLGLTMQAKT